VLHLSLASLEEGLPEILRSPSDGGRVELIVRRPATGEREVLTEAQLDPVVGLVGDTWMVRPSFENPDRSPHPDKQVNIINARGAALIAGPVRASGLIDRRALAGDQLYVDLDLSLANLPPGTRLCLGSAVIEVTDHWHRGCAKFSARFGRDAVRFVNSPTGRALRLRGINTRVVVAGVVRPGDSVTKTMLTEPTVKDVGAPGTAAPLEAALRRRRL
jgi:MOSC domain-containing protein YiiM